LRLLLAIIATAFFTLSPASAQVGKAAMWSPLGEALERAEAEALPVLVYVEAAWCGPCRVMERDVFPALAPLLSRFARASLTLDDTETLREASGIMQSEADWARHFGAATTPTLVVLAPGGSVVTRLEGMQRTDDLALVLAYVATGAYRHADFAAYAAQARRTD
jgi:thioredoxin-related protein